jgi:hypothetical protein
MTKKTAAQTEVFVGKLGLTGRFSVFGMGFIGLAGLGLVGQNVWLIIHGGIPAWLPLIFIAIGLLVASFAVVQLRQVLLAAGSVYTVTAAALHIKRRFGVRDEAIPWATLTRVSRETRPSLRPPGIIVETADRRIMIHGLTLPGPRMDALYEAIRAHAPVRARG